MQHGRRLLPELYGHQHGHIATEAIYIMLFNPETHRLDLRTPNVMVCVVEFRRISPVPRHLGRAVLVTLVPVGRTLTHPHRITRGVVGHPVEQHLHAQRVGLRNERVEIGHRTELIIHGTIVADRVIRSERALTPLLADGIDGHEPYGIDTHRMQKFQTLLGCAQRTFARQLPQIHLIKHRRVAPLGMLLRL